MALAASNFLNTISRNVRVVYYPTLGTTLPNHSPQPPSSFLSFRDYIKGVFFTLGYSNQLTILSPCGLHSLKIEFLGQSDLFLSRSGWFFPPETQHPGNQRPSPFVLGPFFFFSTPVEMVPTPSLFAYEDTWSIRFSCSPPPN